MEDRDAGRSRGWRPAPLFPWLCHDRASCHPVGPGRREASANVQTFASIMRRDGLPESLLAVCSDRHPANTPASRRDNSVWDGCEPATPPDVALSFGVQFWIRHTTGYGAVDPIWINGEP